MDKKEISVKCDVLVVGGGPAGIAAAVSAARAGSRVVLMERYGFLGGLASSAMVGTICGLYIRDKGGKAEYVSGGFLREWAEDLRSHSGLKPLHVTEGLHVLPYDPWEFKRAAERKILEMDRISLVLHGALISADVERKMVRQVKAMVWDQIVSFMPLSVVDCTGEASVLYMSGAALDEDINGQSAGAIFSIDGRQVSGDRNAQLSLLRDIQRGVAEKKLSPACNGVSIVPSGISGNMTTLKVNLPYADYQDWTKMTGLELRSHDVIDELCRFLKVEVICHPVQVGIRSGRRARGRDVLTEEDVLNGRKRPDGVACGSWPIEEWSEDIRPKMSYMQEGEHYEIPIGCLLPESLDNVFMAGRCISASSRAIASARVIGTSICTGWAAGKAAAFQANDRPLSAAVKELREEQVRGAVS